MRPAALAAVGVALGVAGLVLWRESRGAAAPAPQAFFDALMRAEGQLVDTIGALLGVSVGGLAALKRREGFRATAYRDEAGLFTIGYGHKVKPGESFGALTEPEAEALLLADVGAAEAMIARYVTVPLTPGQHDALVSFLFNVDSDDNGAFRDSTLLAKLNAGDAAGAAAEFARWRYVTVDGKKIVSAGLQTRRAGEAEQFVA